MIKLNLQPQHLQKIRFLTGVDSNSYHFLGFSLDLETAELCDLLGRRASLDERAIQIFSILLLHYSTAKWTKKSGELVKFEQLLGGHAYEGAFVRRVIEPIARGFGDNPKALSEAAKLLGGTCLEYGDAAVEVSALKGIPLVFIIWNVSDLPASASVLFDGSASSFLPTEDLAVLGEVTAERLIEAQSVLRWKIT